MIKSKKTIFGTILCILMELCLLVCTLSFNRTNTVLVFGDSISTLNDVLATVTDFPTTEEDAWVSENGAIIYIKDEKLNFVNNNKSIALALNMAVELSGDDYTYFAIAPWHAKFNMKDGKLVSITVDVINDGWEWIAGKYQAVSNTNGVLSAVAIVFISLGGALLLLLLVYFYGYFFLYRKGKLDGKKIKIIYKFLPSGNANK